MKLSIIRYVVGLLGHVSAHRQTPTYTRTPVLHPSLWQVHNCAKRLSAWFQLWYTLGHLRFEPLLCNWISLYPKHGGSMDSWNIGILPQHKTTRSHDSKEFETEIFFSRYKYITKQTDSCCIFPTI